MSDCESLQSCRSCGGKAFVPVLDLGTTPLANRLPTKAELALPEPAFPLRLVFCPECALLQIDETVNPEILFREYLYFSSVSPALLHHAEAKRSGTERALWPRGKEPGRRGGQQRRVYAQELR